MTMETGLAVVSLAPTVLFVALGIGKLSLSVLTADVEPCCSDAVDCAPQGKRAPTYPLSECQVLASTQNTTADALVCWMQHGSGGSSGGGGVGRLLPLCPAFEPSCINAVSATGMAASAFAVQQQQACTKFELNSPTGEVEWAHLFSWTLWLYGGIFGLGTMAGEIERPEHVFPRAIAILIPTLATVYCLPFAVAISVDPFTRNFSAGHFSALAREIGGDFLSWFLFIGSVACFVGLYDAEVMQSGNARI